MPGVQLHRGWQRTGFRMHRIRNAYRAKSIPQMSSATHERRALLGRHRYSIRCLNSENFAAQQPRGPFPRLLAYNSSMSIPAAIQGQKYMSLISFRKNGTAVPTPVWFGEKDDKLYVMTRSDSGKYKRIRNNPQVRIAPCTIRGKITGPGVRGRRANSSSRRLARGPAKPSSKNIGSLASLPSGARPTSIWRSKFRTDHRSTSVSVAVRNLPHSSFPCYHFLSTSQV